MNRVSIIIVNYNTPSETRDCLESILNASKGNYKQHIIVVDNGSKEVFKLPKSILEKDVEVLRSEANLGFTGGNNLGITYAIRNYQSEFFLLINSDTIVQPNFLIELYKRLVANPKAGLVCPKIYFYKNFEYHQKSYFRSQKGKVIWFAGGSIDWENIVSFHRGVDEVDRGQFDNQEQTDFCTGCCMLIKREVIEKIGILDKKYFLYSEDVDFCIRAKKAGFENLFCPKSIIWHKNASSSDGVGAKVQTYYQTRNRLLLAYKFGRPQVKINLLRLIIKLLSKGSSVERKAVLDFFLRRFGKQTVL